MKKESNGFTLLEMLVATMLFGVVLVLVWNVFFVNYNNYSRLNKHRGTLDEARVVAKFIGDEIERADQVTVWVTDDLEGIPKAITKKDAIADLPFTKLQTVNQMHEENPEKNLKNHVIEWVNTSKNPAMTGRLCYWEDAKDYPNQDKGIPISDLLKRDPSNKDLTKEKISIHKNKDSDILQWTIKMPSVSKGTGEEVYYMSTSLNYKMKQ
ncbi:MAG: type II secretion system protein J [Cellulosilyticaceae bacterium]